MLILHSSTCNYLFVEQTAVESQKTIIIAGKSTIETNQPMVPPAVHPTSINNQTSNSEDNVLSQLHHPM